MLYTSLSVHAPQRLLWTVVEKCTCGFYIHEVVQFVGDELLHYQIQSESGLLNTADLGYSVLGLRDTSAITLHILWCQLIAHRAHAILPCLIRHT